MLAELRALPRALWILFAGTTLLRVGSFVFPLLTIYLSEGRGFGKDEVGWILSVGSIGLLLGNLAGGWLADAWSRKRTLLLALGLNAVGFFALSMESAGGVHYAAFLGLGYLGSGMYSPAANTLIADLTETAHRQFAYTVHYVCINLGMALGPLLGGLLAAVSYRVVFLGDVATTLGCAVLIALGVAGPERRQDVAGDVVGERASFFRAMAQFRVVTMCCLASFFLIAPLMGLEYSVPLLVKTRYFAPLFWVGVVYTINAVCVLALSFLVQRVARERSDFAMLTLAGALWSVGLAILCFGDSLVALLLCTAVWSLGEIIASIVLPAFVSRRVPEAVKGRFLALHDSMRSLASIVSPVALGFIWEHHGVPPVLLVLLVLPLIGTVVFVVAGLVSSSRVGAVVRVES